MKNISLPDADEADDRQTFDGISVEGAVVLGPDGADKGEASHEYERQKSVAGNERDSGG
jgi:hypothetical protein